MPKAAQRVPAFAARQPPDHGVSPPPSHDSIVLGSSISTEPTTRSTSFATETNKTSVASSRVSTDSQPARLNAKSDAVEPSAAAMGSRLRPSGFTAINDASNTRLSVTQTSTSSPNNDQVTSRNVSGTSTLVNEIDEPEQRLLDDCVTALDLGWKMPNDDQAPPPEVKQDTTRRRSTRAKLISKASSGKEKVKTAASKLGKRQRDAFEETEDVTEGHKDASNDTSDPTPKKKQKMMKGQKEDEPIPDQNPTISKRAKLAIFGMAGIAVDAKGKKGRGRQHRGADETLMETRRGSETAVPDEEVLQEKPGPVKKWLSSGLHKGQASSSTPGLSIATKDQKQAPGTARTGERTMMPLPIFGEEGLLQKGRDFKLPFDVFSPLPPGQPKPDEWRKFQTSEYIDMT